MYNKILVPLDGSELSACSLGHVKSVITAGSTPEVVLLRVVEPISSFDASALAQAGYMIADVQSGKKADATDYLSKAAAKLSQDNINARGEVIEGIPAEVILNYAEKNNFDLIIMSSHGRTGISRWAFGSVADRVLRHSKVPVLLISAPGCRVS